MTKNIFLISALIINALTTVQAQNESADFMRSTGKIGVTISVLVIIFMGIILFLINLERKLSRLEKEIHNP